MSGCVLNASIPSNTYDECQCNAVQCIQFTLMNALMNFCDEIIIIIILSWERKKI